MHYLFVDGGALRATLAFYSQEFFDGAKIEPKFRTLLGGYDKTFYYDALPSKKDGESQSDFDERCNPQMVLFERLKAVPSIHVSEGVTRNRRRTGQEQKQVDVMIAVDMLTHAHRRNMQKATLLTSDIDFKPLLEALVSDGIDTTLWYPPRQTNRELIEAADSRRVFGLSAVHYHLNSEDKAKYPLPRGHSSPNLPDLSISPEHIWQSKRYGEVRLWHTLNTYHIDFRCDINDGYWIHNECESLKMLRDYLREEPELEWYE